MGAKKVALFVDVDNLHQQLRSLHHRTLDPGLLMETARGEGDVAVAVAVADWTDLPEELRSGCEAAGMTVVQVGRSARSRETGGRRREFVRDGVDVELLAQIIEVLFDDGRPEVARFVFGSCDDGASRSVGLVRSRFDKEVVVLGVEGGVGPALEAAASRVVILPMPAMAPREPELLSRLVPLLEGLEKKKRYLNFKYIRETIVRRLELPERSFDAAEKLLSEAIACGLLLKLKIEDKYNPGQLFTAYALNRDSEWFQRWGSGEPAPIHPDAPEPAAEEAGGEPGEAREVEAPTAGAAPPSPAASSAPAPAAPSFGARPERRPAPAARRPEPAPPPPPAEAEEEELEEEGERFEGPGRGDRGDPREREGGRRKRRRRRGGSGGGREGSAPGEAPPSIPLSAGSGGRRGGRNPQLDRVGRAYEAPSRFIQDETHRPSLEDEDIDEDRILRARGD